MNRYVFSPSRNMFYPIALKPDYIKASEWPEDGIAVDDAVYAEFAANTPPAGKVRIAGKEGSPEWGDHPLPGKDN